MRLRTACAGTLAPELACHAGCNLSPFEPFVRVPGKMIRGVSRVSVPDGILGAMQRIDGHLVLSPTDLTKHVACAHITTLDLEALDAGQGTRGGASGADDSLNLVFAKGLEHERAYLERLVAEGRVVEDIAALGVRGVEAEAATLAAMRRGVDVIYQATFFDGHRVGLADFLLCVGEPRDLGPSRHDR